MNDDIQTIARLLKLSGHHDSGIEMIIPVIENKMIKFARIMCQKQKEICAEEAKGCKYGFYEDLALNSPLPKELQDNEN
jgi:hypothetical protein